MSRKPRGARQPQSRYVAPPMAGAAVPFPQAPIPTVPPPSPLPDMGSDPTMGQALAPWMQPTPQPNFLQPPDPSGFQPQGFLQNWAQNTGGQNPFAALSQYQPRNFGEGFAGGLVQGLGSGLYNRGVAGVNQNRQDYATKLAGTEAANTQLKAQYTEAEKRRADTVNRLLEHKAQNAIDAANPKPDDPATATTPEQNAEMGLQKGQRSTVGQYLTWKQQQTTNARTEAAAARTASGGLGPDDFKLDLHSEPDGRAWFDGTNYTGKSVDAARRYATSVGARFLGKGEAGALNEIKQTLGSFDEQTATIRPKLATTGGFGRVIPGIENTYNAAMQNDPDLAAFPSWFTARIQALRAEAMNPNVPAAFRMTQPEINTMVRNAPKITDSQGTWDSKIAVQKNILNRKLDALLGAGAPAPKTPTVGRTSHGVSYTVNP